MPVFGQRIDRIERYQPEIDGLRAVAITAAVLFHARVPGFDGGFVGVDVFFVISGFLITRMLLAELNETGKIDFFEFYARRIRRLFPALIAVVVVTLALGTLVLSAAGERQELSVSAAATVGFVANIYFSRLQDFYFAGPAEWIPLLNMWTLSVEEQFYLVWPALLVAASIIARITKNHMLSIVAMMLFTVFIASLAVFLWGATAEPAAAFYLTPTRVWEFALGGALAVAGESLRRLERIAGIAAIAGLLAIVVSVAIFRLGLPYPVVILSAAFGATSVIAGVSAKPDSLAGRVLAAVPVVVVGKLSYSWYLWHWPLLALVRLHYFGEPNLTRDLLVAFGSLGFAALTYTFLENPIRRRMPWPFSGTRVTVAVGAGMSTVVAGIALALYIQANAAVRSNPWLNAIEAARSDRVESPASCNAGNGFSRLTPAENCLVGAAGAPSRILLWGDSHAEHFVEMIREDGARNGYAAIVRTMSGCAPLLYRKNQQTRLRQNCLKFDNAVADEIPALAQTGVTGIVLSSRLYGLPEQLAPATDIAASKEGLRGVLSMARGLGLRVVVIAPVPTFRAPVPSCLTHLTVERCGIGRKELDQRRAPLVTALSQVVSEYDNAQLWDTAKPLCNDDLCVPVRDGKILYSDWSHLSLLGSGFLAPVAAPYLAWLRRQ